jgi:hypothetical protein
MGEQLRAAQCMPHTCADASSAASYDLYVKEHYHILFMGIIKNV